MRFLLIYLIMMFCFVSNLSSVAVADGEDEKVAGGDVSKVICNVVQFVQKLGVPIMTAVIIGSSVMAIFGRLAWPAIMVLVVFTGIFFGAGKVVDVFVGNISSLSGDKASCNG